MKDKHVQDNPIETDLICCPICDDLLWQSWENTGFNEPGAENWEVNGFECKSCGYGQC